MALSSSLGQEYMDQFYRGAYFRMGEDLCLYKGHVAAKVIRISIMAPGADRWASKDIPSDAIEDMSSFAWPKLGYREFPMLNSKMTSVWLVSSSRSAMRGLQERHVKFDAVPQYEALTDGVPLKDYLSAGKYMTTVFRPEFSTLSSGMRKILDGSAIAFALNEDFAVAVSIDQGPGMLYDVMYRGAIIGQINSDDEVILPLRLRKRSSIQSLFEGRVRV